MLLCGQPSRDFLPTFSASTPSSVLSTVEERPAAARLRRASAAAAWAFAASSRVGGAGGGGRSGVLGGLNSAAIGSSVFAGIGRRATSDKRAPPRQPPKT